MLSSMNIRMDFSNKECCFSLFLTFNVSRRYENNFVQIWFVTLRTKVRADSICMLFSYRQHLTESFPDYELSASFEPCLQGPSRVMRQGEVTLQGYKEVLENSWPRENRGCIWSQWYTLCACWTTSH